MAASTAAGRIVDIPAPTLLGPMAIPMIHSHVCVRVRSRRVRGGSRFRLICKAASKKDDNASVFVAGASGRVGSRTVRELLQLGFRVRAGVRNLEKFQDILGDVLEEQRNGTKKFVLANLFSFLGTRKGAQLEAVEYDLENAETIEPAIGNSNVVICTIGASESEVLDVSGPYRVDYQATKNLIEAAKNAGVAHFVLVTSLGTTKFGWPAAILNLFWGVLIWKKNAEKALIDSGLSYTIVRPGGMERPTDSYKETHNLRLGARDSFVGGQVSRLQIAELLACITDNLELAENKVVEAIAETTAPLRSMEELLAELPVDSLSAAKPTSPQEDGQSDVVEEDRESKALKEKVEAEFLSLREKEKLALAEAENSKQKKAEALIQAKEAAAAALRARTLADATAAAAKKGMQLNEEEKQKILASKLSLENGGAPSARKRAVKAEEQRTLSDSGTAEDALEKPEVSEKQVVPKTEEMPANGKPSKASSSQQPTNTDLKLEAESLRTEEMAPVEGVRQPFGWFWQGRPDKNEQETAQEKVPYVKEQSTGPAPSSAAPVAVLSPYARYPDLKPPASPSPRPPNSKIPVVPVPAQMQQQQVAALPASDEQKRAEEATREPFRWFWQRKPDRNDEEFVQETLTYVNEQEFTEPALPPAAPPEPVLSPYARYPDLKPPASPSPRSPVKEEPEVSVSVQERQQIAEAPVFDKQESTEAIAEDQSIETKAPWQPFRWFWQPKVESEPAEADPAEEEATSSTYTLSPYTRYADLKPPASPTPRAPIAEATR